MSFLEPEPVNTGLAEPCSRLFGGLLQSARLRPADPPFLTQHNAAAARRRPLLRPQPLHFGQPAWSLPSEGAAHDLQRMQGMRAETVLDYANRRRNLMTGELTEENKITIWTVDDNGSSNDLFEYQVKFREYDQLQKSVRIQHKMNIQPYKRETLPCSPIELRKYDESEPNTFFLRHSDGLKLCKSPQDEEGFNMGDVYKSRVHQFCKLPHIDDVAFVDDKHMVFYGAVDGKNQFARVKTDEQITNVVGTDSPAHLLLAGRCTLYQSDIRAHQKNLQSVFVVDPRPEFSCLSLSQQQVDFIKSREVIHHLQCVEAAAELYLITTYQRIVALDRRMPHVALFSMNHFDMHGADYVTTLGPYHDPETDMNVHSYLAMNRCVEPAVSHWAIGQDRATAVWSSMGPKRDIPTTEHILKFRDTFPTLAPDISDDVSLRLPRAPRAFHCQLLPRRINSAAQRSVLFRQMDNGQIWTDTLVCSGRQREDKECFDVNNDPELKAQSIRETVSYIEEHDHVMSLVDQLDANLLVSRDENMATDKGAACVRIRAAHHHWSSMLDQPEPVMNSVDDVLDHNTLKADHAELAKHELMTAPKSDDYILSKIVIDMTNKANAAWDEKFNPTTGQRQSDQQVGAVIVFDGTSDPAEQSDDQEQEATHEIRQVETQHNDKAVSFAVPDDDYHS